MSKKVGYIHIDLKTVKEYNLNGSEALIFGIIDGFSKNDGVFYGSLHYLMENTNLSKPGVMNVLKKLVSKGLIIKKTGSGVRKNMIEYRSNLLTDVSTNYTGMVNKFEQNRQKILLNINKEIDTDTDNYFATFGIREENDTNLFLGEKAQKEALAQAIEEYGANSNEVSIFKEKLRKRLNLLKKEYYL